MSDNLRRIENACAQINKTNLINLRDSTTTAHEALDIFDDSAARISIDGRNPKVKVPAGCRRLLQWTQLVISSSTIIFLSPLTNNKTETSTSITSTHPRIPDRLAISLGGFPQPPIQRLQETKIIE
ncbi:hypothetical protein KIN20_010853 [Parelaphostrongylus tenuis]|uniref:Uncharacterized protein n=1 Tax=Parelaphostrongylus tenuis TaxID=148309 RepID=A0AAD5MUK2_PARTN|nr:hypothetical protein KIN20_010853 [Parelaphostrongylus tenuis]